MTTSHPLYLEALVADEAYSAIIQAAFGPKATRWTLTSIQAIRPDVLSAYRAKVNADTAWLQVMREASEQRSRALIAAQAETIDG